MDDAALQLPDDPALLKRMIVERDRLIARRDDTIRTLQEDNALLQHRLRTLLRASYGPRAERFDPRQLLLFGLLLPSLQPMEESGATPSGGEVSARPPRKPHGRRRLPDHLPRIRIEHDLEETDKLCPCCGELRHPIGEELTEQLEHVPANFVVLQHARHKYACSHCNSGQCPKCDGQAHIDIADKPHQPIERGLAGPGLLAYVITSKLADHLPLYRIQQIFARQQVDTRARPILEQIKWWLDQQRTQVLPRSPMGQAITYVLNQWPALCIYTTDGRLSIDNNTSERALRRVAAQKLALGGNG